MEYDVLCPDVGIYRCFAATQSVREDERVALSFLPSDTPTPVMRVYKSIPTKMKDECYQYHHSDTPSSDAGIQKYTHENER